MNRRKLLVVVLVRAWWAASSPSTSAATSAWPTPKGPGRLAQLYAQQPAGDLASSSRSTSRHRAVAARRRLILTLLAVRCSACGSGTLVASFASTARCHAGDAGGALPAARQLQHALRRAAGRHRPGRRSAKGRSTCSRCGWCPVPVLRHQPGDGADGDACHHLLVGQPAGHAGRHAGVRERRHAAGAAASLQGILSARGCSGPSCCWACSRWWHARRSMP
jgi:hypothetical protein